MPNNSLYQHGTLGTLMAGALEGTATIEEILKEGDHGIATLTGSNGEVIFVDGKAYHADADTEAVTLLQGDEQTPYATVSRFEPETTFDIDNADQAQVYHAIRKKMLSDNVFVVVKITGVFHHMHFRVMPKQEPPYTRLVESARKQPEYHYDDIEGTVVAIFTPELFHGIGSAGFHAHFLSKDKQSMGHILDFTLTKGHVQIQNCYNFHQHLPTAPSYLNKNFDYQNIRKDIEEAE